MRAQQVLYAFNRGIMSPEGLVRLDLKRTALSAEIQENWLPRVLGSMRLRPGTFDLGSTEADSPAVTVPFVFATDDTAIVELTANKMRVWADDALVSRPAVTTTVPGGTFSSLLAVALWTNSDEAGALSAFGTGGNLVLTGTGSNYARRDMPVIVATVDQNIEHSLLLHVLAGEVRLSIGSTQGGTTLADRLVLGKGVHSIGFTPSDTFWIRLEARQAYPSIVDQAVIGPAGAMVLDTVWGVEDLPLVRYDQSGSVVFACDGVHPQQRIVRWDSRSWGCEAYLAGDGPFHGENLSETTLAPSVLSGSGTLTASRAVFKEGHVGALFRISSNGQKVRANITAEDQWTDAIRVTGVNASRIFTVTVSGRTAGTVTLQRSIGVEGDWANVVTYSADTTTTRDDGLDNQVVYYRIGVEVGGYAADTFTVGLDYPAGSIEGICRITGVDSPTLAGMSVLKPFGGLTPSKSWWEGLWSDYSGWPTAVALHDGRLWWVGNDKIDGSVSDAYASFDDTVEGDAGPVSRGIGSGPVNRINWAVAATQLLIGTQGEERAAKASTLDEPLTPSAFTLRTFSTQGSASVPAVKVDTSVIFVQRNARRVFEARISDSQYGYASHDLTLVAPDLCLSSVRKVVVQRQPDTRIHVLLGDGTVAMLVYDAAEEVTCWVTLRTDGIVEDAVVLPGNEEDAVYYIVQRLDGDNVLRRRFERHAQMVEATGRDICVLTDSSKIFEGPIQVLTGFEHLEGKEVAVWGNTRDLGRYVVSGGEVTLSEEATAVSAGLPYVARYMSARFAFSSQFESVGLTEAKKIGSLGLVLFNTHSQGLKYGDNFEEMDSLPLMEDEQLVAEGHVWGEYEKRPFELDGTWTTDSRLCLEAESPRPCTVAACVVNVSGHGR